VNSFQQYVDAFARLMAEGVSIPLGEATGRVEVQPTADAPVALLFSPHPDDEVIIGGLPLRLMRECGWRVINIAVTQGSNLDRRAERWTELNKCCDRIGFELLPTRTGGLDRINPESRRNDPTAWRIDVELIAELVRKHQPAAIFMPHTEDWNVTHIGTNLLVTDAFALLGADLNCLAVETEFWRPMQSPNLVVESSAEDLAHLLEALSFHVGEISRNPYHLTMPAWMINNVRRGTEVVGGQGGSGPAMGFATLYRLNRWNGHSLEPACASGKFITIADDPQALLGSRS
jgi:LmbE family N-acetylglucosaminyl deacetylase